MKISFFIPNLHPGGAENVLIEVINKLVDKHPGCQFHLCVCDKDGVRLDKINSRIKIINFSKSRLAYSFLDIIIYLKNELPQYFISSLDYANLLASLAHQVSFVSTKLILWEHSITSKHAINTISKFNLIRYILINYFYKRATSIICVSKGVSNDLNHYFNINRKKLITIYNPIDHIRINKLSLLSDFESNAIIKKGDFILCIARLVEAKNLSLLINAFNNAKDKLDYKLIIMGEGPLRSELESLIIKLNLDKYIFLIGYLSNPYFILKKSKAIICSSKYEGLSMVLIESLALGKYIVSTDCSSGPREILDNGKYGTLVPSENVEKLSRALRNIDFNQKKIDKKLLIKRSKFFTIDQALNKFNKILNLGV